VAPTDATVLILGESGSGKELFAREVHQRSRRAERPLITVNCSAIPHEVFESEFFGHVRGAFTGAVRDRPGRFQLAHGGTIFLDEVGDIPLDLQPKLLRVLQEGQYERVGEDVTRHVSVRVIAATNRDLSVDVKAGRFREDLYYRLTVFPLQIPPLRDRRDDIPRLAAHLVTLAAKKLGLPAPRISEQQCEQLQRYDWPGNVRELQNLIERAVILSKDGTLYLDPAWLPQRATGRPRTSVTAAGPEIVSDEEWRRRERENLETALKQAGGRIMAATEPQSSSASSRRRCSPAFGHSAFARPIRVLAADWSGHVHDGVTAGLQTRRMAAVFKASEDAPLPSDYQRQSAIDCSTSVLITSR
jgi:transcriptional regulator with GAF, ATPase, and Fis domain